MFVLEFSVNYEGIIWQKFYNDVKNAEEELLKEVVAQQDYRHWKDMGSDELKKRNLIHGFDGSYQEMIIYKIKFED